MHGRVFCCASVPGDCQCSGALFVVGLESSRAGCGVMWQGDEGAIQHDMHACRQTIAPLVQRKVCAVCIIPMLALIVVCSSSGRVAVSFLTLRVADRQLAGQQGCLWRPGLQRECVSYCVPRAMHPCRWCRLPTVRACVAAWRGRARAAPVGEPCVPLPGALWVGALCCCCGHMGRLCARGWTVRDGLCMVGYNWVHSCRGASCSVCIASTLEGVHGGC